MTKPPPSPLPPPCSHCGGGGGGSPVTHSSPMKRRSTEISANANFTEPKSKRPMFLDSQETSPMITFPNVRRNISDPLPVDYAVSGSGLPPRPPSSALRRSISDPISTSPSPVKCLERYPSDQALQISTPSSQNLSRSSSCVSESSTEQLKMIKHCVKQLFQLCHEPENEVEIMDVRTQDQCTMNTAISTQDPHTMNTATTTQDPDVRNMATSTQGPHTMNTAIFTQDQHTINTTTGQEGMDFNTQEAPTQSTVTDQDNKLEELQLEPEPESEPKLKPKAKYEESVVVEERDGEPFVEIKCTCGECYHLLLSGGSCYYEIYHHADHKATMPPNSDLGATKAAL
ncbi:hypothetical protein ACFE04_029321 [Oxalis oulophora]